MENYNKLRTPPKEALKQIAGGRLSGMTDIKPQWRIEVMTEVYGTCGIGWKFEIKRLWSEAGSDNQILAFAEINLKIKEGAEWSDSIPGIGGSMLVAKETNKMHSSDEAYKMAVTDALSTAMKCLGVAADIYMGLWDGSKYKDVMRKKESPLPVPPEEKVLIDGINKIENQIHCNNWYIKHCKDVASLPAPNASRVANHYLKHIKIKGLKDNREELKKKMAAEELVTIKEAQDILSGEKPAVEEPQKHQLGD